MLGIMLWGLEAFQVVWYYINYPEDSTYLKIWVALLSGIGTSHEILMFIGVYRYLVRHFGDIKFLVTHPPVYFIAGILLTQIVSVLAQGFFIYRIYVFAQRKVIKYGLPLVISPFMIWEIVGSSLYVSKGLRAESISGFAGIQYLGVTFTAAACAADIIISCTMCGLLYHRRTGTRRADQLIAYLILVSINTGFWTAVMSIAIMIILPITPIDHMIFMGPYLALSSLYINSVLCNLNIRQPLRGFGAVTASGLGIDLALANGIRSPRFSGSGPVSGGRNGLPDLECTQGSGHLSRSGTVNIGGDVVISSSRSDDTREVSEFSQKSLA